MIPHLWFPSAHLFTSDSLCAPVTEECSIAMFHKYLSGLSISFKCQSGKSISKTQCSPFFPPHGCGCAVRHNSRLMGMLSHSHHLYLSPLAPSRTKRRMLSSLRCRSGGGEEDIRHSVSNPATALTQDLSHILESHCPSAFPKGKARVKILTTRGGCMAWEALKGNP